MRNEMERMHKLLFDLREWVIKACRSMYPERGYRAKYQNDEHEPDVFLDKRAYLEALAHADTSDNLLDLTALVEWRYKQNYQSTESPDKIAIQLTSAHGLPVMKHTLREGLARSLTTKLSVETE
jgi:hypothetical protein